MIKSLLIILLVFLQSGCATVENGRHIQPQDLAFIEKGKTTRAEVIQRLGRPMSEGPDLATMYQFKTTSTTTTTKTIVIGEGQTQQESVTTTQLEPVNRRTKAMYLHTKSEAAAFHGIKTTQERLYVIYDDAGIVQDYSFEVLRP